MSVHSTGNMRPACCGLCEFMSHCHSEMYVEHSSQMNPQQLPLHSTKESRQASGVRFPGPPRPTPDCTVCVYLQEAHSLWVPGKAGVPAPPAAHMHTRGRHRLQVTLWSHMTRDWSRTMT